MNVRFATIATIAASLVGQAVALADDESEAKRIALDMTKRAAVEFLKDREFEFEGEALAGTAQAVEPEEHVEVEIKDFMFVPGRVSITFVIGARFGFDGTLKVNDEQFDVEGTAKIESELEVTAEYWFDDGRLRIDSRVTDGKFEVEVLELKPDTVPGGKRAVEEMTEKEIKRQQDELIRELNAWIAEQNRP